MIIMTSIPTSLSPMSVPAHFSVLNEVRGASRYGGEAVGSNQRPWGNEVLSALPVSLQWCWTSTPSLGQLQYNTMAHYGSTPKDTAQAQVFSSAIHIFHTLSSTLAAALMAVAEDLGLTGWWIY